jgi:surface antigen/peptidoglycan hydrolase CwlO-like protein
MLKLLVKNKNTMKHYKIKLRLFSRLGFLAFISCLIIVAGATLPDLKNALIVDATCNTITDCEQQVTNNNNAVEQLENEATSYQNAISILNAQINQLQTSINAETAEQAQLQQQMQAAQAELNLEKSILASDITAIYINGQMTVTEELASSKNLSDFVNAQTYRNAVQNELQTTVDKVTALQNQIQIQEQQLQMSLKDQQTQEAQLGNTQNQQQQLLGDDQSQQAAFNTQTAQNQQELNALIAAQRRDNNASAGGYYFIHFPGTITNDPINGTYLYADSGFSMSTAPGCNNNDGPDQWGYCTRQCVSYAAWAVAYSGRIAPVDWSNAKDWVSAAKNAGIPFDITPQPGDVAITTSGEWGHAMYVEQVSGNQIYVSEYNQQLTGEFSTQWRQWE